MPVIPAPDSSAGCRSSTAEKKSISLSALCVERAWEEHRGGFHGQGMVVGDHTAKKSDIRGIFRQALVLGTLFLIGFLENGFHQLRKRFMSTSFLSPLFCFAVASSSPSSSASTSSASLAVSTEKPRLQASACWRPQACEEVLRTSRTPVGIETSGSSPFPLALGQASRGSVRRRTTTPLRWSRVLREP